MTSKRGQPPKPPEKQRNIQMKILHTELERALLEEAYRLSKSKRPLARWVATMTVEEAEKIVQAHKQEK